MASIRVAQPHGFCAGVARALRIADEALRANASVWCLHAIV
ncbi:MAG: 4-hydroxy-3-methylbut-2-enyl diphosphate reductase, partial [Kiritimatiellia bacterium]|nr:4-hydroxy-3-methylbut-2-enyl diphosphate reductase [Kiritimatiellia bacterium]